MRIAVDVMGGDHGCDVVINGTRLALHNDWGIDEVFLVGQQPGIEAALQRSRCHDARLTPVHASEVITMDDKPLEGARKKRDSSMVRAIELVREGRASAVISPGNTGALVAGSIRLRRLDGVERPVLAARMPSRSRDFVLIDAGANPVCEPAHLAQFAVMGNIYAREILGVANPRVGVLSNGSEESKGNELTREAARLCGQLNLNFVGYVEGFDLFNDGVDVVVTDGFTGNVVLKTSESLGYTMKHLLEKEFQATPLRMLGALLARGAFRGIKSRMDPDIYGGAVLLGPNGIVVKAHGSARETAIMNAIRVAVETIRHKINETIVRELGLARQALGTAVRQPAVTTP